VSEAIQHVSYTQHAFNLNSGATYYIMRSFLFTIRVIETS